MITVIVASTAATICAWRDLITRRVAAPFPDDVYLRFRSSQRNNKSPATALNARTVVSTYARPSEPFSFDETICVARTLIPPPNTYGAENEPSDVMKTRSVDPAIAGVR